MSVLHGGKWNGVKLGRSAKVLDHEVAVALDWIVFIARESRVWSASLLMTRLRRPCRAFWAHQSFCSHFWSHCLLLLRTDWSWQEPPFSPSFVTPVHWTEDAGVALSSVSVSHHTSRPSCAKQSVTVWDQRLNFGKLSFECELVCEFAKKYHRLGLYFLSFFSQSENFPSSQKNGVRQGITELVFATHRGRVWGVLLNLDTQAPAWRHTTYKIHIAFVDNDSNWIGTVLRRGRVACSWSVDYFPRCGSRTAWLPLGLEFPNLEIPLVVNG